VAIKLHLFMRSGLRSGAAILATVLLTPGAAHAASTATAADDRGWSVGGGIGLTASPTTFLMNFDLPYNFGNNLSLGPQMQIGVTGGATVVSMTANGRYDIDFSMGNAESATIRPFVNAGLGFTYESIGPDFNIFGVSNSGTGFLIAMGGGLEFRMTDHVSLESAVQFNIIASGAGPGNNDHFYWSWQMLGVRLRF